MNRSYKFRLNPNRSQRRELEITLETHRRLYNAALDGKQLCWETARADWSYNEQSRWFTIQRARNPHFARTNSWSANTTLRKLDKAFKAFFSRVKAGKTPGYPRFKSRERFDSFSYDMVGNGGGCKIVGRKLRLQHIGTSRVNWHREIPSNAKIKQATIKRDGEKWFVCFSIELPDPEPTTNTDPVGIDVGLESFLTTSEGESEQNPRYLKTALPELRRAGRSIARKKLRGSNRRKAVRRLQKVHARVRNLRREHHCQVACKLVRRYGLIAAERLNVSGMVKNGRFARSISDAGWSIFIGVLRCKAQSAGVQFVEVDPKGTSQECNGCGETVKKPLSQRWHECSCGCSLHRDHNAALNILARARLVRTGPAGANVADCRKRSPRSHLHPVVK